VTHEGGENRVGLSKTASMRTENGDTEQPTQQMDKLEWDLSKNKAFVFQLNNVPAFGGGGDNRNSCCETGVGKGRGGGNAAERYTAPLSTKGGKKKGGNHFFERKRKRRKTIHESHKEAGQTLQKGKSYKIQGKLSHGFRTSKKIAPISDSTSGCNHGLFRGYADWGFDIEQGLQAVKGSRSRHRSIVVEGGEE